MTNTDSADEKFRRFRHDLANPLSAILAETQLLLMRANTLDAETVASLKEIEALSRRMRDIMAQS